ncbi:MAG: glycosyltransferase family 2 protein [Zoogloeaceae bacterium]|jgi:rhamnosyltransferase|nr:glycosyltransferase family 2 protein [Zoogloeaceae bacterium]
MEQIAAIIVSYKPVLPQLARSIAALRPQVAEIIVVNNGNEPRFVPEEAGIHFLSLGENRGIAKAQNEGIELAEQLNASHVLLMDQDSIADDGMVVCLLAALKDKPDAACVGPRYMDDQHGLDITPFVRLSGILSKRIHSSPDDPVVEVDQLIASGSLIPMDIFQRVGKMREDLFIDYVDIEWCFRARNLGYRCYGVHDAVMRHSLGNRAIVLLGLVFTIHGPIRYYYRYRNAILLFREKWIRSSWKVACFIYISTKVLVGALLVKERFQNLKMIFRGVVDGLKGASGKIPERQDSNINFVS